jgi:hypothetical protein
MTFDDFSFPYSDAFKIRQEVEDDHIVHSKYLSFIDHIVEDHGSNPLQELNEILSDPFILTPTLISTLIKDEGNALKSKLEKSHISSEAILVFSKFQKHQTYLQFHVAEKVLDFYLNCMVHQADENRFDWLQEKNRLSMARMEKNSLVMEDYRNFISSIDEKYGEGTFSRILSSCEDEDCTDNKILYEVCLGNDYAYCLIAQKRI